jgi:hypothetical protein
MIRAFLFPGRVCELLWSGWSALVRGPQDCVDGARGAHGACPARMQRCTFPGGPHWSADHRIASTAHVEHTGLVRPACKDALFQVVRTGPRTKNIVYALEWDIISWMGGPGNTSKMQCRSVVYQFLLWYSEPVGCAVDAILWSADQCGPPGPRTPTTGLWLGFGPLGAPSTQSCGPRTNADHPDRLVQNGVASVAALGGSSAMPW